MKLLLLGLLAGCAATTPRVRIDVEDSYCSGNLCVSGVQRGLDRALDEALKSARVGELRLHFVEVVFRERDAEAGQVELTYQIQLRNGTSVITREETLTRPYDDGRAPIREAVLRLLVDVVSRVSGTVARANAPVSM